MLKNLFFAQILLGFGVAMGLLGLCLWWKLPFPEKYPPFAITSLLAIAFALYEFWHDRGRPES